MLLCVSVLAEWAGCWWHQWKVAGVQERWVQTLAHEDMCGHGECRNQRSWKIIQMASSVVDPWFGFRSSSWPASPLEMSAIKERFVGFAQAKQEHFSDVFGSLWLSVFPSFQNFVVAVGAEGWFHLFDLTAVTANKADSSSQHEFTSFDEQKPLFTQHIPANTKVILISDIGKSALLSPMRFASRRNDLNYRFCSISRWRWPLWAGCGLHRQGGASIPLGRADRWSRLWNWAAYPPEEMAAGGAGGALTALPCVFTGFL